MTKKIMFNDKYCLTQAVLDGTKTMTRRVERLNPYAHILDEAWNVEGGLDDKGRWIFTLYNKKGDIIGDIILRYNIGEVVAIAQSYNDIGKPQYGKFGKDVAGNNNKLFVKADLLPHHIRITDVKAERLRDISDEDILKEGIFKLTDKYFLPNGVDKAFTSAREAFAYLIDKISGKGTWESNPWVVAYSFELVD